MIKNLENFRFKVVVMTILLVLYYLWIPPLLLMEKVAITNSFYAGYIAGDNIYALRLIATLLIILVNYMAASLLLRANDGAQIESYIFFNKILSNVTVSIMCILSVPLLYNLFLNGLGDRTTSFKYMSLWRHHPIISGIFSVSLISSLVSFANGDRRNILVLFFWCVLPELLYGTRISIFRIVFMLGVFLPWRSKYLILLSVILIITGFARSLFNNYSSSSIYDYLILFFGDPINITLGTSFLESNLNFKCGVDGLHFIRSFLPPFHVRAYLDTYLGDVTICINEHGFGVGAPNGLGGSPVNDILVAPTSFFTSTLVLLCFMYVAFLFVGRWLPIFSIYLPILVVSCAPYIMRNGIIATSNHIITVALWMLIPILVSLTFFFRTVTDKGMQKF